MKRPKTHWGYRKNNRHKSSTSKIMNPVKQALKPATVAKSITRSGSDTRQRSGSDARQRSGSDARQRSGSDTPQGSASDTRQSSGSDIATSVHTERRSESMREVEEEYPQRQPPEQPKPPNTSTREAPKMEAPKREGFINTTKQRASRRMTRSQRAQVLDQSAKAAAQNIQEDDPLLYEEAMACLKKQS
ncbi:hypothetical protein BDD12DRAFT_893464 [Trichophaea hybrida]|nr:hypothetical protein BDD12DRAFT_893464 [Trichophaea hybrida]